MQAQEHPGDVYAEVLRRTRDRGIAFAVGGGMAMAMYVPQRMSTKDLDIYVKPFDRQAMIDLTAEYGLGDYYGQHPYDRHWIYRSYTREAIVDVMWGMPNRRAQVDDAWLTRGPEMELYGERVRILPPEELIWAKLYVLQRDRSDWPDILNILYATAPTLDWVHLINRVGCDAPLLQALLSIFGWLCPARAAQVPAHVLQRLEEAARSECSLPHDHLLDTRLWFLPRIQQESGTC